MASSHTTSLFHLPDGISDQTLTNAPDTLSAASTPSNRVDPKVLHVLNRVGFGPRPGDIQNVQAMGLQRFIQQQLNPKSIALPNWIEQGLTSSRTLQKSAAALYEQYNPRNVRLEKLRKEAKQGFENKKSTNNKRLSKAERQAQKKTQIQKVLQSREKENKAEQKKIQAQVQLPITEISNARIIRAINSPRQLEEVMVNFWFNHFNVSRRKGPLRLWTGIYEEHAIRPHVMGSFRELLGETAHHPAMLYYLDNVRSKVNGINENYARELLELHTLGVDGGYTLKDIQEVARVFTGWKFVGDKTASAQPTNPKYSDFYFDRAAHDFGSKTILGRTIAGTGELEGETVLDLLATHPATAKHISFKLAQYFVADSPPSSLVEKMSQSFLTSKGNITAVLGSLFSSQEFWDPKYFGKKFKTPYEYLISSYRGTGQTNIDTNRLLGMLTQLGMPLYACETPDGYKNVESAWLSPEGMMRRVSLASAIASGSIGTQNTPANPNLLAQTLGYSFSGQTLTVLKNTPPQLQASAILGSPEMMMR